MKGRSMKCLQRITAIVLIYTLIAGLFTGALINEVEAAKTSRAAKIESLEGTVTVKKAGGSKQFKAFKSMSLNEGDHITVGDDSSVILSIVDREDEVTIGENSKLYISELSSSESGTSTGVKMWSGSIWVKAKTLASEEDTFEVETPTAVMGVRGTQFAITVQPHLGDTSVFVASGVVQANALQPSGPSNSTSGPSNDTRQPIQIYPSMQGNILSGSGESSNEAPTSTVSIIDPASFASNAGPAVIEALIRNKAEADKENKEFMDNMKKDLDNGLDPIPVDQLGLQTDDDLSRLQNNLNNLVPVLVNEAIQRNVVNQDEIDDLINQTNASLESPIRLDQAPELELTDEQRAALEKTKRIQEQRQREAERAKQQLEEKRQNHSSLLDQIQQSIQRIQEQNQQALEQARKRAQDLLLSNLTPEQQEQFQERLRERENERTQPRPSDNSPGQSEDSKAPKPGVALVANSSQNLNTLTNGSVVPINVMLKNFRSAGQKGMYAIQLHIVHNNSVKIVKDQLVTNETSSSPIFNTSYSAESYKFESNEGMTEMVYSITNFDHPEIDNEAPAVVGSTPRTLLRIPFEVTHTGADEVTGNIQIYALKIFDRDGNVIYEVKNGEAQSNQQINYRVQPSSL